MTYNILRFFWVGRLGKKFSYQKKIYAVYVYLLLVSMCLLVIEQVIIRNKCRDSVKTEKSLLD